MKLRFFSAHEMVVLHELKTAYGRVSAEIFFNQNEIKVLKYLMTVTDRKNIKEISEEINLSRKTTKNALDSLKEKEAVDSNVNGISTEWWHIG